MSSCSDDEIDIFSQKLKVIGHPVRLKMLCIIENNDESCVTNLWTCLNQPQPVVSQHLAVLKTCNIVTAEIKGTKRFYTITDPFVKKIIQTLISTT